MIMRSAIKISLTTLLLACLALSAQAAQFFPLQTGQWMELDKHDNVGNTWTVRLDVLEEVTQDEKQYFHVREQNYDPPAGEVLSDMYIRSTETEVYAWNGPGLGETLAFKEGSVGDYWLYDNNTKRKEIVAIESITIPFGGAFTAYQYKHYRLDTPDQYDLEWVVPGLGLVKEEDHWVDPARIPVIADLARAGQNPFFNLRAGARLIYNSSDNQSHTWHMMQEVREQVTLGGQTYTRLRQSNYDPYQADLQNDIYIRCTDKEVYRYNGNGEDLIFQTADKDTSWVYPVLGGTIHTTIDDIVQVTVPAGGPFVAYIHRSFFRPIIGPDSPPWYYYVVPGEAIVKIADSWLSDPARAPLTHELAKRLRSTGLSPLMLLLTE